MPTYRIALVDVIVPYGIGIPPSQFVLQRTQSFATGVARSLGLTREEYPSLESSSAQYGIVVGFRVMSRGTSDEGHVRIAFVATAILVVMICRRRRRRHAATSPPPPSSSVVPEDQCTGGYQGSRIRAIVTVDPTAQSTVMPTIEEVVELFVTRRTILTVRVDVPRRREAGGGK